MATTMPDAALRAVIIDGLPVFPCNPLDKSPLTSNGFKDATDDPGQIKRWWEKWPNAMIGMPTGAMSGIFVVDLDHKPEKGIDGTAAFASLAATHDPLPETARQRTPSGGEHILFRMPPLHIPNSASKLGRGVDIRGDGGYAILAPSVKADGKTYEWISPLDKLAEAPQWILDLTGATAAAPKKRDGKTAVVSLDTPRAIRRATKYLRDGAPHGVAGSLSDGAYRVGCQVKDLGVSEEMCVSLMTEHWPHSPPMSLEDMAQRVRNSYKYGRDAPGVASVDADFDVVIEAQPYSGPEWLKRMNERYAVTTHYNKSMIHELVDDPELGHPCHRWIRSDDLRLRHRNESVVVAQRDGKNKHFDLGTAWLDHPQRRQYEQEAFLPGMAAPAGVLNLWNGWAVTPKPGDWSKMRTHIREIICDGDDASFAYLLNWMARLVQKPYEPGQVAIVLQGKEGTGKGSFVNYLAAFIGQHYAQITQPKHLIGSFNQHLREKVLVFADEALFAGDRQQRGPLYSLITEPFIQTEAKGFDAKKTRNVMHIVMATNEEWAIQAGEDARRFAMFHVNASRKQDITYFEALKAERDRGGADAMLNDLLNHNIGNFDVYAVPKTEALAAQKLLSLTGTKAWLLDALQRGGINGTEWTALGADIDKDAAFQHYKATTKDRREHKPDGYEWWARRIRESLPGCVDETRPNGGDRRRRFIFSGLARAREAFAETMGCKILWESDEMPEPEAHGQFRDAPALFAA